VPPGLSNDEISIAYNAYSLVNTGKDEYGKKYPLTFRSFNDYKAPLYVYLVTPFIRMFGNNEASVRFPSLVLGSMTVFFLGLLIKQLTRNQALSLWSSFFLAITPWHIYTSRVGYESNVALFLVVLGAFLFLLAVNRSKWWIFLSVVVFSLSIYTYHTELLFVPLLLGILLTTNIPWAKKNFRIVLFALVFFLLFIAPYIIIQYGGSVPSTRAGTELITKDFRLGEKLRGVNKMFVRVLVVIDFWIGNYLSYFSPDYIFFKGLSVTRWYNALQFGLINLIQFPFFLIGLFKIIKFENKWNSTVFAWLVFAPLIPSLTQGELNSIRNLVSVVPLTIICAYGTQIFVKFVTNKGIGKNLLVTIIILTCIGNFLLFYHYYLVQFPKVLSESWSYGFKQIASYLQENGKHYTKIIVDPNYGTTSEKLVGVPSLFIFYFNRMEPWNFKGQITTDGENITFENYEIRRVDWPKEIIIDDSLYVVGVNNVPLTWQPVEKIHSIYLLNGKEAFAFYRSI
jgi:4-amino-4-deoxy-L-arabinose transferase-like glycosyltransferase